jgi:rhodanese-related sulfurtransferase
LDISLRIWDIFLAKIQEGSEMKSFRNLYVLPIAMVFIVVLSAVCFGSSSINLSSTNITELKSLIDAGSTAPDNSNRVLIVDVSNSKQYIKGHIENSLSVPLRMIARNGKPIYTNGYDKLNTKASTALQDSWLAHMLINQLVNDSVNTYQDSTIIFYGSTENQGRQAARVASKIGYQNVSYLSANFANWSKNYPDYTEEYYTGVVSVDPVEGSFIFTGFINDTDNFENVSTYGTHHGIVYKGGGLHEYGLLQSDMAPFPFQELLTFLGASPRGNMAKGIYYGEYASKHVNGQRVEYEVTWPSASRYYTLDELFEEKPSAFQPSTPPFQLLGIEARIGGTRESNINWNPGCIFCFYSCVCGITSNARANDDTWFADGGTYDYTDNPTNYYAGRYYPRMDILPGKGQPVTIKVRIIKP